MSWIEDTSRKVQAAFLCFATLIGAAGCGSMQKSGTGFGADNRAPRPGSYNGYPEAIVSLQREALEAILFDARYCSAEELNKNIDSSFALLSAPRAIQPREQGRERENPPAWESPFYARSILFELQQGSHSTKKFASVLEHSSKYPQMSEAVRDVLAKETTPRLGDQVSERFLVAFAARCPDVGRSYADILEREARLPVGQIRTYKGFPVLAKKMRRAANGEPVDQLVPQKR